MWPYILRYLLTFRMFKSIQAVKEIHSTLFSPPSAVFDSNTRCVSATYEFMPYILDKNELHKIFLRFSNILTKNYIERIKRRALTFLYCLGSSSLLYNIQQGLEQIMNELLEISETSNWSGKKFILAGQCTVCFKNRWCKLRTCVLPH